MLTLLKTKKNRLNGCCYRSNSQSIFIEKELWLISLNKTFSVLEQRSVLIPPSKVNGFNQTRAVLSQNGLQKTQLQQKSNSAIENTCKFLARVNKIMFGV
ncbi:Hypothetical_protein [Hexamita inflata]|uniref:Hypothetical_protein n=1 Tax=Hexamita inflata TaxID=28002 RepID=A0AA86PZ45_9EUKA|nr:Hypothetical protein HINF_LOCUS34452 [Hexamita inflata]